MVEPEPVPYPFSPSEALELDTRNGRCPAPVRVRPPHGDDAWLVTRYADVQTVLSDRRFSRSAAVGRDVPRLHPADDMGKDQREVILNMEGDNHSRLRRLVSREFTPARVRRLAPRIDEIVDDLLNRISENGPPVDLMRELCYPLSITVICEVLGVEPHRAADFLAWSAVLVEPRADADERLNAIIKIYGYIGELVAGGRETPTASLLGSLVSARDQEALTEAELLAFGVTLLVAGYETTANQLANSAFLLLSHPDQWRLLQAGTASWSYAVEELLRYVPLVADCSGLVRYLVDDVELGGVRMAKGDAVITSKPAANRDPALLADPNRLDVTRPPAQHMSFGHGPHYCLGAPLARMEIETCLRKLMSLFPGLRLAVSATEIRWKEEPRFRGPISLPVAW